MHFQVSARDVMTPRDKVIAAGLVLVYLASIAYYAIWWFQPQHVPMNWPDLGSIGLALDTFLFVCLSFVIWRGAVLNLFAYWVISAMKAPVHEPAEPGLRVAMVTYFVPGKEPLNMLEKTLAALTRVSYPHDTWVLDEGDDPTVKAMCRRLGVKHFSRKGVPEYNQLSGKFRIRTKSGNHNAWADRHANDYDVVAQMDLDFVPRPEFLERTLGYFRDPKVAFVGAPQIHGNQSESWIAKAAAEQVFMFYGPMQQGFFGKGMQMLIGGVHVYRTEAWRDIDWYSESITEDHVTGMKVYARGWKSVYVPEILCAGEVPADMLTYLGQQMRWAFGLTDIMLRYTPGLLRKLNWTQRMGYINLQFFYYFGIAHLLALILIALYMVFGIAATTLGFTDWVLHAAPPFFINIFVFRWLQKFNIDPEREKGYCLKGALLFYAVWPAVVLGLVHAFMRHKLYYNITRKGSPGQSNTDRPSLHILAPYLLSAGVSLIGLVASPLTGFSFPPLVFWAALNLAMMVLVVLTMWQPTVPVTGPVRVRSLRRTFPLATALATTVLLLLASINVPTILGVTPSGTSIVSTTYNRAQYPTEAQFLEPGSRRIAIGALADSGDELESISKISHLFVTWEPEQLDDMVNGIRKAAANNQVSMISWQPLLSTVPDLSPTRPDRETLLKRIINGEFDRYVAQVATILKNTKQPILLRFAHEMDIEDSGDHPWAEQPPELYIAAYQHIHHIFEQRQTNNVIWVWSPSGYWKDSRFISLDWYPGDNYVDVIGLSILVFWQWDEWDEWRKETHWYRSPKDIIGPSYAELLKLGKPVVLAELGVDLHAERKAERKAWLQSMLELVRQEYYSNIVAVVFFNKYEPSGWEADWRFDDEEMRLVVDTIRSDDYFELSSRPENKQVDKTLRIESALD